MNNKKWYTKSEMIVALSALLISVVTATIGVYSAYIDRAYARASVWPRLEIFRSHGKDWFEYGVTNNGTGPALIKYAKVEFNSKIIHYWRDIPEMKNIRQSHLGNRILPSQATIKPVESKEKNILKIIEIDGSVNIAICYCSIYEECWITDRNNQPKSIANCEINTNDKFLQ
ncbi:MAG: hypothetical protein JKY19_07650 [Alcanivoracaceae bacterium]|nr:hypothetical protein [Alcanivoracaceae bacterium]